ncbi:membrane protein insertase YidC [Spiroplasma platyhelix]|uniref:Membrane protein insertase YidC n=1 Tax=Spiroplasma platyhelix PALS-1 TaxID=1276218 RepID=A0A846U9K2_9MOLU|nr:membrane protein insertase YidC [Spiroplasma platyhelix]MBE4704180.1 Membrane protein insertase YidC [Spiroplasma platyhelix PALS-1]NKE38553.1 membrane protein insertase YidC [Spiroplasma platyhelix PALS-1]UJB29438.1 inner membrane protein translocase component YidC [Spiroplasma platyhelix PALS-1]
MRYKQFLFPEEQKKTQWLKITWKWTKIVLGTFLLVSTIWGCGQMMGDSNVATSSVVSLYDFQKHNIAAVFFELLIGTDGVFKHHVFHFENGAIYEYSFNGISTWGQAWAETKSPFYGLFVYPIAWLLVNIAHGMSGGYTNIVNPVAVLFAILFTTLIIKMITLVFTFKAQQNQEKMQAIQLKTSEIQAKYKYSRDPQAKQKMQMELMGIYKKEGINPIASFIPMFLSIPFLTAMFTVIKSTTLLKTTQIGLIKLIETPWSMITHGEWIYLVIVVVYLPIQLTSMLLPMFLNRSRQKVKTKESKAAMKKQVIIQSVFIVLFTAFVFGTPSGVGIYWIISGGIQIIQTLGFHYYNKQKRNRYKRKGTIQESFSTKIKNQFNKITKINQRQKPKKAKISLKY